MRKIIVVGAVVAVVARGGAADLADGQQPAIEAVRQRVVSGNAVPLSLHATGVAAEHVADERPAGGGAAASRVVSSGDVTDLPVVQSALYLALLISNALFLHVLTVWAAKRWFRASYANFASRRTPRRPVRHGACPIASLKALLFPFPQPLQLLLIKDWRLLRRDPVQWSQFLIFFGLLGLYFLNVDRFNNPHSDIGYITWINMVSFLNLAVVGLDSFDVYDAVHLPDDQPGRALLLDSGPVADRARYDPVEQVLVRVARFVGAVRAARAAERHDAATCRCW